MTKKLQPKLRFRGFTDAWEQRKLGEIAKFADYGIAASAVPYDGVTHYLRITDIDDETRQVDIDDLPSPDKKHLPKRENYLQRGDLVFARTGASVGKTYLNRSDRVDIVYAGFLIRFRFKDFVYPEFVYQQTLRESYRKFVAITSQRSGQPGINSSEYSEWALYVTSIDEQKRIGVLFGKLDQLIAAEKRKLNLLEKKKSALLQQIFDQKIRFKDYVGPWKQREFGAVYKRRSEKNNPIRFKKDRIITVSSMRFLYSTFKISEEYLSTYNIMREGDIAFEGNRNSRYAFGRFVENTIGDGIVSHVFNVYQPIDQSHDLLFWKYYINNDYIMRNILKKSTISATMMRTLIDADLKKQILVIPSSEEQKKIGKLFGVVDSLLAAEGRKIDLLILKKKSLLQQMFV